MEKRKLGKTGMEVTLLGYGGAEIGYEGASLDTVKDMLNQALDSGLNIIDTAECYLDSEELIGKAVSNRRNDYYLFTKCGHGENMSPNWTKHGILATIERSLKRLRTDYVDLLQLHSCSLEVLEHGDAIMGVEAAREKGYTRFVGYSGDSEAAVYAINSGAFDTLQTSLNIADQEAIDLTLPLAREREMGVIIKRPIANAAWRTGQKPEESYHHTYWDRLVRLEYPFLKDDLKKSIEIALRFTAFQPGVTTMIVGTKQPGRWLENEKMLAAGPLPQEQLEEIRTRWSEVAGPDWVGQT